jgi:hypothetical protein
VDTWVRLKAQGRQEQVVERLLAIGKKAAASAALSIVGGQPFFQFGGPVAFIKVAKAHVTFGFWRSAELSDPDGFLEEGRS